MARKPLTLPKKIDDKIVIAKPTLDLKSEIKVSIKHKNEKQKKLTQAIKDSDMVICTGPAGTGKTYVSCLQALLELKTNKLIKQIVLVKSVTTLKSEEIGFLKGTMEEKMEPFMYSFTGNFEKLIGKELFIKLKTDDFIEILPIAYLRGVNIDNAIVIIDETQNITVDNIRTIMTRLGENSKMIFLGDINQVDAKNKNDSALKFLLNNFKNIDRIGVIEFTEEDIVRHPLVKTIEVIFKSIEEAKLAVLKTPKPNQPKLLIENKKPSFLKRLFSSIE